MRHDAVVVLNYNGWDDTLRCLQSLADGSPDADVLVVDNGSHDPPPEDLARRWPGVRLLRNGQNLGFTGGMNVGINACLERGADTVTVLNNDTVVPPGVIARLGDVAATGVAVSPEVRYLGRPDRVWFGAGGVEPSTNLPHHLPPEAFSKADAAGLRSTAILAGCCLTADADTWRRVGLFDERYFLNFEDSDWSVRAQRSGVPLAVDTSVTIGHAVSASFTGAYSYLGLYYYARNGLLFGRAHHAKWLVPGLRFLRRYVVPSVVRPGRDGDRARSMRLAVVLVVAVFDFSRARWGRAPALVERLADRWNSRAQEVRTSSRT